jgi:hypothetical protein
LNGTTTVRAITSFRQAEVLGRRGADERLVEMAVILAVEDQDLVAAGGETRDADRLRIGRRGRQGELPGWHAEAIGQQAAGDDGVLGRQQEVAAVAEALGDRAQDGLRAEAAGHAEVALGHVEVAVAVDVLEVTARALGGEDLGARIERRHPGAGDAVRHERAALRIERARLRRALAEPAHLLFPQGAQLRAIQTECFPWHRTLPETAL